MGSVKVGRSKSETPGEMMSYFSKLFFGLTAFCSLALISPVSTHALPGMKSLPGGDIVVQVRRECIAWERNANGQLVCVNWAECTQNAC
jgi:hypothetical protein